MKRLLNVIDLEATCWEGEAPAGQSSEIIEVGLSVLDLDSGEITRAPRMLMRPVRSEVSAFCTALTGITTEQLSSAPTLRQWLPELHGTWCTLERPWASWGAYDRKMLAQAQLDEGLSLPVVSERHTNAKVTYAQTHHLKRQMGMARALDHAHLDLQGRHHQGDDDAYNIARLIWTLAQGGHWNG